MSHALRVGVAVAAIAVGWAGCSGNGNRQPEGDVTTIIRGEAGASWIDLIIKGEQLDAPDGTRVVVQVGMPERPPERLGYAETRLAGGAFRVVLPDVWETGLYKKKVILLDRDGDRACDGGERVLADLRAEVGDEITLVAAPSSPELWGDFFVAGCDDFVADWPRQ
jgi:hypothetical protein